MSRGRPSVADERREQILDAVVRCILQFGVAGTTRARIAEQAGMKPSAVHHFAGTRAEVVQAGIESATRTIRAGLDRLVYAREPPEDRLNAALDGLFGEAFIDVSLNQLIDALVAYAYRDQPTREALHRMYTGFLGELRTLIGAVHPKATAERVDDAALGVLALGHAAASFAWLGIEADARLKTRRSAEQLIRALANEG